MKTLLAVLAAAVLAAGAFPTSAAAEAKAASAKSGWSTFFRNLKKSLGSSAVSEERKRGRGTHVAAVRGKKQKNMADPNEPTLMGDSKTKKARQELTYDAEFAKGIDLLSAGKCDDGLGVLQEFKEKHPKYRVEEVDKAIEGAKFMISEKSDCAAKE